MQDEVEVKARELLAQQFDLDGEVERAAAVRRGWFDLEGEYASSTAVRAIAAALRQRPVVGDARMARALEWIRAECVVYSNPEARTHLPAIEEAIAAYDPNCGGRTVRVVDDAIRKNAARYEWLRNKAIHTETPEDQETCWAVVGTCAHDACPIDGQDLDEIVDAALLAAYQQDNGGK